MGEQLSIQEVDAHIFRHLDQPLAELAVGELVEV